eukprot:15472707-Alexandrium_andersonii.AAC.2
MQCDGTHAHQFITTFDLQTKRAASPDPLGSEWLSLEFGDRGPRFMGTQEYMGIRNLRMTCSQTWRGQAIAGHAK